jgi:hypothetical protein
MLSAAKCRSLSTTTLDVFESSQLALVPIVKLLSQLMIQKSSYDQDQVERYRTDQECKKHGIEEFDSVHGLLPTNDLQATCPNALGS